MGHEGQWGNFFVHEKIVADGFRLGNMATKIFRSITEPIRKNMSWDDRWNREDQGLIACWERGREKSKQEPDLASLARSGELVVLP